MTSIVLLSSWSHELLGQDSHFCRSGVYPNPKDAGTHYSPADAGISERTLRQVFQASRAEARPRNGFFILQSIVLVLNGVAPK